MLCYWVILTNVLVLLVIGNSGQHKELYKYAHVSNAFQACENVRVLFPARVSGEF